MDFSLTEEQEALREQARDYLEAKFPPERIAELEDAGGWDRDSWREFAELGWLGVSVPEEHGGAGLGFLEEAVIFEEMGRALYRGPYFSTIALALPALTPALQTEVARGEKTWTLAVGGAAPDEAFADSIATIDGGAVVVAENGTRTRLGDAGDEVVERIRLRALAALSLEAVGIAQKALELALEHASTREQFGKPIGAYQAVSHAIANTYVDVELARSLAYWAAWAIAQEDEQARVAVAAAKSFCPDAAVTACERSIQVHGGIGFTWEHPLHRYYRRAQWIQAYDGFGAKHRAAVADAILG